MCQNVQNMKCFYLTIQVNYINSEKDDKALPMIRQRKVKVHIIKICDQKSV